MRQAVISFFAIAGLGLSAPVSAQQAASVTDDGEKERLVCKRFAKTGTRVKKKVCRTRAEWDAIAEAAKKEGQDIQSQGGINSVNRGG